MLTLGGALITIWTVIDHLAHQLALDGRLGPAGSVLLVLAGAASQQLPPSPEGRT